MKTDDSIFSLIHSMTTSEKRFLKRLGNTSKEEEDYLTLFTLIDNQKIYDEEELKRELKKKGVANHISWSKNYLTKQILRSLRAYHSDSSAIMEAIDLLKSVEILFRKLQNKTCIKLVAKGLEICERYEFWYLQIEFVDMRYKMMARTGDYKELIRYGEKGKLEKVKIIEKLRLHNELRGLIFKCDVFTNHLSAYSPKEVRDFTKRAIKETNLILKKAEKSFTLNEQALWVQSSCYMLNIDPANEIIVRSKIVELYEAYPQFKSDVPFKYYAASVNFIYTLERNGMYQNGLAAIDKLRKFIFENQKVLSTDMRLNAACNLMNVETSCYLALDKEKKALEVAIEFEKIRPKAKKNLRKIIILNGNIFLARTYWRNGLFEKCKTYLKEILFETTIKINPEVIVYAHLLRISVYAVEGKWDNIPYFITEAKKIISKSGRPNTYAVFFLEIISKLEKTNGKIPDREIFNMQIEKANEKINLENRVYKDMQFCLRELLRKNN